MDGTVAEENQQDGSLMLSYMPSLNEVTHILQSGKLESENISQVMKKREKKKEGGLPNIYKLTIHYVYRPRNNALTGAPKYIVSCLLPYWNPFTDQIHSPFSLPLLK